MDLLISSATHRMGSTMVQRIFNTRDKNLIWGENGGCLSNFVSIYKNTVRFSEHSHKERQNYFGDRENSNTWIANMTPDVGIVNNYILKSIQEYHKMYHSSTHDFVGYKEVRYGKNELELFRYAFPKCNVILLVRNPLHTYNSIITLTDQWYNGVSGFMEVWQNRINEYVEIDAMCKNFHLVKYEDIVSRNPSVIEKLCDIGKLDIEEVNKVLNCKIGSAGGKGLSEFIVCDSDKDFILSSLGRCNLLGY